MWPLSRHDMLTLLFKSDPFDFVHVSNLPSGYNEDEYVAEPTPPSLKETHRRVLLSGKKNLFFSRLIHRPSTVRDTNLLITRRINVLKEKAAASRLIPMEDRHLLPPSPIMTSPAAVSPATMSCSYFANSHSTPHLPPPKSRAGYRGLAASTGAAFYNHNASESQRPSIAHSLATVDDVTATTALSPTSSVTTASSRSGWKRG